MVDKKLEHIGNGVYAYVQTPGTWGWSNAGLVTDGGKALLVDTLQDYTLTGQMHSAMLAATQAAKKISHIINTHSNGDHCNGNGLFPDAEIIVSSATAEEMKHEPSPAIMAQIVRNAPPGSMVQRILGGFDFTGIVVPPPTRTFEERLLLQVGAKRVQCFVVGPAHTSGDTLIYLPEERIVFTGDILFIGTHPVMWAGPTENWLRACDRILELDVDVVVPGHGAITDKNGVRAVRGYLQFVYDEVEKRYKAGIPVEEATREIGKLLLEDGFYRNLGNKERIVVNVDTMYRNLQHSADRPESHKLFRQMGEYLRELGEIA